MAVYRRMEQSPLQEPFPVTARDLVRYTGRFDVRVSGEGVRGVGWSFPLSCVFGTEKHPL